jgi:hypothetical protein
MIDKRIAQACELHRLHDKKISRLNHYAAINRNTALHLVTVLAQMILSCSLDHQKHAALSLLTDMIKDTKNH